VLHPAALRPNACPIDGTRWNASTRNTSIEGDDVRKRLFHLIVAALVAVLAGTLAGPAGAYASAPNPGFRLYPAVMHAGNAFVQSTLPVSFQVGDCILTNSYVSLDRPDNRGRTKLEWFYSMYTLHTNNFDQWHATFRFRDAVGNLIFEYGPVDSAEMHHTGPDNGVQDVVDKTNLFFGVRSNFRTFDEIASIEWQGEC